MQPIIYDVAVSLDGFISGPSGDISKFAHSGPVVDDYVARLSSYSTAIMGRATYEFGYEFGLVPGANPYPHLNTFVFSESLVCPATREIGLVRSLAEFDFDDLKQNANAPIYLCGGGAFAGSLLKLGLIDVVRLKRAPIVLGDGVKLFGSTNYDKSFKRISSTTYDNGYLLEEFEL